MKQSNETMPAYRLHMENGAYVFTFFCMASGAAVCTTKPVQAESEEEALKLAWRGEARGEFNLCHRCGKWVADVMYNADTLKCVDCSPWEEPARFCSQCGVKVDSEKEFCQECKNRLRYGNGEEGIDVPDNSGHAPREIPENYGFGNEVMKQTKVCTECRSIEPASRYVCSKCRQRLPAKNLFQLHQSRNRLCPPVRYHYRAPHAVLSPMREETINSESPWYPRNGGKHNEEDFCMRSDSGSGSVHAVRRLCCRSS